MKWNVWQSQVDAAWNGVSLVLEKTEIYHGNGGLSPVFLFFGPLFFPRRQTRLLETQSRMLRVNPLGIQQSQK
jgi:hypothetical protein